MNENQNIEYKLINQLMWDYNIQPENIEKLLKGEIETYAHYNRDTLFKKILETYPWFTILKIIDIQTVRKLLTEKLIKSLRSNSLKEKYLYVRKRLCEIIPITE